MNIYQKIVGVGADVKALCGRCGESWHVIVAMGVGDKIASVECKRCHLRHRYRPVAADVAKLAASKPARKRAESAPKRSKTPVTLVKIDPTRPSRRYMMTEAFVVGDQIDHSTFGLGVVEMDMGSGKIQVMFMEGRRILVHKLAPPT